MKLILFFTYILTTTISISAWAENEFQIKQLNDKQYVLSLSKKLANNNFKDSKLDAACLISKKDKVTTEHCRLDYIDNKNNRFLSHKFKYRQSNNTIEFSVKDSRNLTAYRQTFSNQDNWLPISFIKAYLKLISDFNIKEQKLLLIDESGLTEVKKLDS